VGSSAQKGEGRYGKPESKNTGKLGSVWRKTTEGEANNDWLPANRPEGWKRDRWKGLQKREEVRLYKINITTTGQWGDEVGEKKGGQESDHEKQ